MHTSSALTNPPTCIHTFKCSLPNEHEWSRIEEAALQLGMDVANTAQLNLKDAMLAASGLVCVCVLCVCVCVLVHVCACVQERPVQCNWRRSCACVTVRGVTVRVLYAHMWTNQQIAQKDF